MHSRIVAAVLSPGQPGAAAGRRRRPFGPRRPPRRPRLRLHLPVRLDRLLLGVSRVDLLAIQAPGALDKVVARYPFDALPPATVAVWPEPALEPDVAGLEARLRAAGYSRANAKAGKRARQPNLQLWRRAAPAPPPPAAVAAVVAAAARKKFMTGGTACTPDAPRPAQHRRLPHAGAGDVPRLIHQRSLAATKRAAGHGTEQLV